MTSSEVGMLREQCRAARALLGWSQDDLERASKVAKKTIADYERGARQPYARTLADLQEALEGAGIIFIGRDVAGVGVRLTGAQQLLLDLQNLTRRPDLAGLGSVAAIVLVQAYDDMLGRRFPGGDAEVSTRIKDEWVVLKTVIDASARSAEDKAYAEILKSASEAVASYISHAGRPKKRPRSLG